MIRTFQALRNVQPGFTQSAEVQLLRVSIPPGQVNEPERVMRMQNDILDKLAAIPGVASVGFTNSAPLEGLNYFDPVYAQDKTYANNQVAPMRRYRFVAPGFLKTTGTALVAGRDFTWTELYEKRNVAMISENMARELWGEPEAALGKRIKGGTSPTAPWREVIGVAADVYDNGVQEKPPPIVYWPALMDNFWGPTRVQRSGTFVIRTPRAATESFLTEAKQAVWSVDSSLPVFQVRTLQDLYKQSLARTAFTLVMLAIAGSMALVLGVVGIYGVIAYAVTQRTREIGIRMALGAQPDGLRKMFVRRGLLLAGIGAITGLLAAAGLTRLMSSLLFGVKALDPLTYAGVAAILIAAAALASYLPARRASRVDPLDALRSE
jgi:predicted permease